MRRTHTGLEPLTLRSSLRTFSFFLVSLTFQPAPRQCQIALRLNQQSAFHSFCEKLAPVLPFFCSIRSFFCLFCSLRSPDLKHVFLQHPVDFFCNVWVRPKKRRNRVRHARFPDVIGYPTHLILLASVEQIYMKIEKWVRLFRAEENPFRKRINRPAIFSRQKYENVIE